MLSILVLLAGLSACTGVFFQPERALVRTPDQLGLRYEDVTLDTADGLRLHAWFLPARAPACGTILFLHGNAENISTHIGSVYWLPERGFNVLMPEYRGYGLSAGKPSFRGLQLDADAAMGYLVGRRDIDARAIVVFGQSLGAATAIYYTAHSSHRDHIRALVAESSFASQRQITREKLASFWLTWPLQYPLAWTVSDDYSPAAAVEQVAPIPLLLMHGDQDPIVPYEHGARLYAAAREPKEFWTVPGGGHISAFRFADLRTRFVSYLQQHVCPMLPARGGNAR